LAFGLRMAGSEQAYIRATAADVRRDATSTTTCRPCRAAALLAVAPEPFLDGARIHTHNSSWRGAHDRAPQHRVAPRRLGLPGLLVFRRLRPCAARTRFEPARARPGLAHAPRDDAWFSRRRQRRPESTASLSGSAVLRELVILTPYNHLVHARVLPLADKVRRSMRLHAYAPYNTCTGTSTAHLGLPSAGSHRTVVRRHDPPLFLISYALPTSSGFVCARLILKSFSAWARNTWDHRKCVRALLNRYSHECTQHPCNTVHSWCARISALFRHDSR
jgi:hypothetical protein